MPSHPSTKTKAKVKKPTSASLKHANNTTNTTVGPSSTVKMTLVKNPPDSRLGYDGHADDDIPHGSRDKADDEVKIHDEKHLESWGWRRITNGKDNKAEVKKHMDSWGPGPVTNVDENQYRCKNNRCDTWCTPCVCDDKDVGKGWGQATGAAAKCSSSADWDTDNWGKGDEWASPGSDKVEDEDDADANIISDGDNVKGNKGNDKHIDDWLGDARSSDYDDGYRDGHREGHAAGIRQGYKKAHLEIDADLPGITEAQLKDALKNAAMKRAVGRLAERTTGITLGAFATGNRNTIVHYRSRLEFAGINIESADPDMVAAMKIIHEEVDAMVDNFIGTSLDGPSTGTRGGDGTPGPDPTHNPVAKEVRFEAKSGGHITPVDGPVNNNASVAAQARPVVNHPIATGQSTQPGHPGLVSPSHQCPHGSHSPQGPLGPPGRPGTPFPKNRLETQATDDGQNQPGPTNAQNHHCGTHYGNCNGYNFCQCQCCVYYDKLISRKIDMAATTAVSYIQQEMVANGASVDATQALMQKAYQMGVRIGQYIL